MADLVQIATSVVSGVTALGFGVNWVRGRAEAKKLDRDGFVQLADSGVKIAVARAEEVEKLRAQVRGLLDREYQRDQQALEHRRWDFDMIGRLDANGITVPPPPPLFLMDPKAT